MGCLILITVAIGLALIVDYRRGFRRGFMIDNARLIQGLKK